MSKALKPEEALLVVLLLGLVLLLATVVWRPAPSKELLFLTLDVDFTAFAVVLPPPKPLTLAASMKGYRVVVWYGYGPRIRYTAILTVSPYIRLRLNFGRIYRIYDIRLFWSPSPYIVLERCVREDMLTNLYCTGTCRAPLSTRSTVPLRAYYMGMRSNTPVNTARIYGRIYDRTYDIRRI